eukprot:CAMPEP_0203667836 /NCGR_PEP_ID=MMETSP0090-20130426/4581_1 /ASSEMBLY_ACC=CAM_ASM_001088 /TAXON_ID=426623 /ORGANISM="Chaetoceros affinis, Strain CCMP159" /LENGTH=249 /DNA_ID=CAMNT_0050532105 /DNA_START=45 /DNA_END=794 /DNA_ORIENTATION=-
MTLVGRKDLPKASHFLGTKIGQVVGLLQGARARADRFATNNELKALQNELRSGLRELDTVKGELAVAASSRGLIGRGLGRGIKGSGGGGGRIGGITNVAVGSSSSTRAQLNAGGTDTSLLSQSNAIPASPAISNSEYLAAAREAEETNQSSGKSKEQLPPRSQSVAAVAEEEWEKQGIGFKSIAEMGGGSHSNSSPGIGAGDVRMSGSFLLSDLMQQSLIHDQYDRAVIEQDEELMSKVQKSRERQEAK